MQGMVVGFNALINTPETSACFTQNCTPKLFGTLPTSMHAKTSTLKHFFTTKVILLPQLKYIFHKIETTHAPELIAVLGDSWDRLAASDQLGNGVVRVKPEQKKRNCKKR